MIYLIACIFCTFLLGIIFRVLQDKGLSLFHVVLINYVLCTFIGLGKMNFSSALLDQSVFIYASINGLLFIIGFNIFALSIHSNGLGISSLVQKLSVFATVLAAVLLGEVLNLTQIIGLLCSIIAIYLIFNINKNDKQISTKSPWLLLLSFILASMIEIVFLLFNKNNTNSLSAVNLTPFIFLFSTIFGLIFLLFQKVRSFTVKEILYGCILGLPNYFSIEFLNKSLQEGIKGAVFFPLLNISVILLSGVVGYLYFKEKYSKLQLIGYAFALIAIILVSIWK